MICGMTIKPPVAWPRPLAAMFRPISAVRSSGGHAVRVAALCVLVGMGQPSMLHAGGPCDPCDANCDTSHDFADVPAVADLLLLGGIGCSPCAGDMNADTLVDGRDIQLFVDCITAPPPPMEGACCHAAACAVTTQTACAGLWLGAGSACGAGVCPTGNLTAHRPQRGTGYFPMAKTAVAEMDEEHDVTGPGIRINVPGDADAQGEDDLIEVLVASNPPAIPVALRREAAALRVWTTRTKQAGTEIIFTNDKTPALPLVAGTVTVWVEWAEAAHGFASMALEPLDASDPLDTIRFHTFRGVVMSLGGENQVPSVPVDPNNGTFVVGIALYNRGYDVFIHDEDDIGPDGAGLAYNNVVDAITNRMVDRVAIFGYSHGGGSTYDLSERLDVNRAGIGVFEILVTSYVDAVGNDSDFDVEQELRRPPSTGWHANHYQTGSLADFFLDGGPVPNSNPAPSGLNVETTPWGAGSTHFQVDDFVQVRSFIETSFVERITP